MTPVLPPVRTAIRYHECPACRTGWVAVVRIVPAGRWSVDTECDLGCVLNTRQQEALAAEAPASG